MDDQLFAGMEARTEERILEEIVEAMLTSQAALADATGEVWSQTLLEACRRRKHEKSSELRLQGSTAVLDRGSEIRRMAV